MVGEQFFISQRALSGSIQIPPSKSQTLRAILFGALGNGETFIHNYLPSPDTFSMVDACKGLGAKIEISDRKMKIEGVNGRIANGGGTFSAGNSGIVLRFCSAAFALGHASVVLTGDESLQNQRPMQPLLDGLNQLGGKAHSLHSNGYAPVSIQGPIHPGKAIISGEDSQPVSAMLIAQSFVKGPSELMVKNPGELPWVALTLHWFDRLGIAYQNDAFHTYRLEGGAQYPGFEYTVPGDFSSAAFSIAAALVTQSELTVQNIDFSDPQGDKELISVFQKMGAKFEIDPEKGILKVKKSALRGISVDINNFIDAITILAVVACFAEGETHIYNAAIARCKECNRIDSIAKELQKMGADIEETKDGLRIRKSVLSGAIVHSHNDHRMALSLAVAGLGAMGETHVTESACIAKTYPTFVHDFNQLGASIRS